LACLVGQNYQRIRNNSLALCAVFVCGTISFTTTYSR